MGTSESEWIGIIALSILTLICYVLGQHWYLFHPIAIFASAIAAIAVTLKLLTTFLPLIHDAIEAINERDDN